MQSSRTHSLVFSTFLLALLVGSFLLRASSYLPTYNPQVYPGAFTGRRFLISAGAALQVRNVVDTDAARYRHTAVIRDDALYCDRSHERTDVCVAKGDVRVVGDGQAGLYEVVVFAEGGQEREEKLKPYTRKWEDSVMNTIDEVKVIRRVQKPQSSSSQAQLDQEIPAELHGMQGSSTKAPPRPDQRVVSAASVQQRVEGARALITNESPMTCEVQHEVPAILFSTGGYTGNVYHEFNDGLLPLFITAQQIIYPRRSPGQVVLVVLEYHHWWMSKYAEIVAQITNYTVIDLAHDKRVHCFPEVTVGLRIHDELAIHADDHSTHASMQGFQSLLRAAYLPRLQLRADQYTDQPQLPSPLGAPSTVTKQPKLVIISRSSSRAILNQQQVITLAEEIGFSVQVLSPTPSTEMVDIYSALSRCDVMVGVHGAAMTHLLFMRAGATLIQVVPLGTDWAAATYYGEPARKMGLKYVEYKVSGRESSLWEEYGEEDAVVVDPEWVNRKGWAETKRIYLEGQNVTVSLARMGATLRSAFVRAASTPL